MLALLGLTAAGFYIKKNQDEGENGLDFLRLRQTAECAAKSGLRDQNLNKINKLVDDGCELLLVKYPQMQKAKVTSGLRGTNYFIEFPITGRNVDAFSLLASTKQLMTENQHKKRYGVAVTHQDSYLADENVAYSIDFQVNSSTVEGTKSRGSVYIRGVKGADGWDSFKFILEKSHDFSDFDALLFLNAYEQALKPRPGDVQ